jgi:DNA repair exonuclease SbcCD ATPase subunit
MEINKINIGIDTIDKIFHVSDVHIRTLKRHQEYRNVFENMFLTIAQEATDRSICIVTGDIVHSKLDMSPELINMLTEFFNGFMLPTIVILGNHDMNLNNMHRIDALSPIINVINNKNIHFIKDNGLFEIGGVLFNHMAIDVAPTNYIKGTTINTEHFKIALHHGAVHSARTDIGYKISNEHVTVDMFDGHDLCLLGDIHKANQILQTYHVNNGIKKPETRYVGSLIQQNHGEALEHGILVWDLPNRTAEFLEIQNDFGYITFEIENTTIVNAPKRMPKRPRVRVKFKDTTAADMKKFITALRKKYSIEDISIQRITDISSNVSAANISIGNVRDVEYQNTLITEHIENNYPQATDSEIDAIRHINRTTNSKLPVLESVRNITWHPVSFEFSNMFSYGDNNQVDFTKLQDVVGLFAPNTSGKSSLLDAITYTIFDKCSKTGKAKEILNNKSNNFYGRFVFEMNGINYTIERIGTKQKSGHVKVNVKFYTDSENLNGEERSETNKNIRKYLGTYDDFILTAFSLQSDNNNFINKSQRERKDLLSQFLDITVFEQLYQLASEDIKETAGKLKEYKKTDFAQIINDADDIISQNIDQITHHEEEEARVRKGDDELRDELLQKVESKLPTTYTGPSINQLKKEEQQLTDKIQQLQDEIEEKEQKVDEKNNIQLKLRVEIKKFDRDDIEFNVGKHDLYNTKIETQTRIVNKQRTYVNGLQEKIQHLDTHEYDPNCKYCTSNVFVKDALEAKDRINDERDVLTRHEEVLTSFTTEQQELSQYLKQYSKLESLVAERKGLRNDIERDELRLQILENELQTKESELETCLERQEQYIINQTAIETNQQIEDTISIIKDGLDSNKRVIAQITTRIKNLHGEIEVAKTKKKHALASLESYKKLETEYKAYEYYLQSVKRNGVPYDIITKALPKIEAEINNVLNQIVDFNMVLNTDGKNINGYIIYDEDNFWPLELTSGMERFISSLAIRVALINVSALPRPNFIAIDEGWGSLDSEHIAAVINLFEYFRNKFDFSIIISHVDSMRDMVDKLLEVNKQNGFSQIQNT